MSQTVKKVSGFHKISIRNKNPGQLLTGATALVFLDDKPLKGVTFFKLEVKAKGIARISMDILADVEVDAEVELKPNFALGHLDPISVSPLEKIRFQTDPLKDE